jgi:hypothetical protein
MNEKTSRALLSDLSDMVVNVGKTLSDLGRIGEQMSSLTPVKIFIFICKKKITISILRAFTSRNCKKLLSSVLVLASL